MSTFTRTTSDVGNQKVTRLAVSDGTSESFVEVYHFGAHVTKWEEKGQPTFIFCSKDAILDGTKAIRGGIPVCFPQFSGFGPLPAHGFARSSTWEVDEKASGPASGKGNASSITFKLTPNEASKKVWDHAFVLTYTVTLVGTTNSILKCNMGVDNNNTDKPFQFTTALHTYFKTGAIDKISVDNLQGLSYMDQLKGNAILEEKETNVKFPGEVDSVYYAVPSTVRVLDEDLGRATMISTKGFPDAVVWNPWIKKSEGMKDLGNEEYKGFCCVEAAAIKDPVSVAAGSSWSAELSMTHSKL